MTRHALRAVTLLLTVPAWPLLASAAEMPPAPAPEFTAETAPRPMPLIPPAPRGGYEPAPAPSPYRGPTGPAVAPSAGPVPVGAAPIAGPPMMVYDDFGPYRHGGPFAGCKAKLAYLYGNPHYLDEYLCGCLTMIGVRVPHRAADLATRKMQGLKEARPMPFAGTYNMAYPLNPDYADPRDSSIYAAQGYGVPVASPISPQIDFQYNYSWGAPGSRITPLSRPLPPR